MKKSKKIKISIPDGRPWVGSRLYDKSHDTVIGKCVASLPGWSVFEVEAKHASKVLQREVYSMSCRTTMADGILEIVDSERIDL